MNGIAASTMRQRREIRTDKNREADEQPRDNDGVPPTASADSHSAAVRMSFIGCTAWKRTIGLVAVRIAAVAPAMPPASCRAIANAARTSTNAAIGVSQKIASWPKTAASGAINTDMPGAQIGAAASAWSGERMNPPGASVRATSGHGASASALCGCSTPARERLRHQRIAGRIRSADGPRAAHDAERRQSQCHCHGQRPLRSGLARRSLREGDSF